MQASFSFPGVCTSKAAMSRQPSRYTWSCVSPYLRVAHPNKLRDVSLHRGLAQREQKRLPGASADAGHNTKNVNENTNFKSSCW